MQKMQHCWKNYVTNPLLSASLQFHPFYLNAIAGSSETNVQDNSDIMKVNSVPQCICCQHLQQELQTVLLELQTTKKIIELLHEETNSTVHHTFTNS